MRIKENKLSDIDEILGGIGEKEEEERRANCLKLYRHFRNNYKNVTKTVPVEINEKDN